MGTRVGWKGGQFLNQMTHGPAGKPKPKDRRAERARKKAERRRRK